MGRVAVSVAVAALALAPVAQGAAPFWWWTPAKAQKAVVWSNPQAWSRGGHTTIVQARDCRGLGRSRIIAGSKRFRDFRCSVVWRNDETQSGPYFSKLFFRTSKYRPYGVACYSPYSYSTVLSLGCP